MIGAQCLVNDASNQKRKAAKTLEIVCVLMLNVDLGGQSRPCRMGGAEPKLHLTTGDLTHKSEPKDNL